MINTIMSDYLLLALLWAAYCTVHSVLISIPVTSWLRTVLASRYPFWRLFFNIFSIVTLEKERERVRESGNVMKELLSSSSGVPISVLNKAECVIVLPSVKKAGFIIAGQYGKGVMTCRGGENFEGPWSAPTMMQSAGGKFWSSGWRPSYRLRHSSNE
jgi:hypothetical protein